MKEFHLITVGKLKDKHLEAIEADYLKRIKNPKLILHEVKASADHPETEAKNVIKKVETLSSDSKMILLTEFGTEYDSQKFSRWLSTEIQNHCLIFVVCGAQGPSSALKEKAHFQLSLSALTLPHKLARILLVEQLYRAQTIREGHPYHN
ncbi:MAG: 50S rRNA methyltransferase [Halobacteriovoraceae bacterium]|nr:50S rRNA methyltransferase [Halobacteriovoraceae bacterium]|tara:strand:- start:28154 stop:28603 length:450 start_codon:yes stop_codon:yes gene_type:complete